LEKIKLKARIADDKITFTLKKNTTSEGMSFFPFFIDENN